MKILKPDYYDRFRCIAGACPDSCCKEWEVDVDPDAAAFYRKLPGDLGDRLRSVLQDTEDGVCMTIENRRCPMWRQDGLCRIQAELGHDALCKTCREFPRLRHDYGDFAELGLELSCPEAARLILNSDWEILAENAPDGDAPEYDEEVMSTLLRSRQALLGYLSTCDSPRDALAVMLLYGYEVQNELDGDQPAALSPDSCLAAARRFAGPGDIDGIFAFFRELEILTPQWKKQLDAGAVDGAWDRRLLRFARYGIERYWLQAVSDFDLVCRVKLIVIACLLVNAMGGDLLQTAQAFSKEIENDPDNLEAILDGAYSAPCFTDASLLGLLLGNENA